MEDIERIVDKWLRHLADQDGWEVVEVYSPSTGWAQLSLRGTTYEAPCCITEDGTASIESLDKIKIKGM